MIHEALCFIIFTPMTGTSTLGPNQNLYAEFSHCNCAHNKNVKLLCDLVCCRAMTFWYFPDREIRSAVSVWYFGAQCTSRSRGTNRKELHSNEAGKSELLVFCWKMCL